jgi:hypothetical protein
VRLTNPGFTLIMLLLLLYGCQLESLGAFTPNSEQLDPSPYTPQSVLLRFALASTFYLAIGAAQVSAPPGTRSESSQANGWFAWCFWWPNAPSPS